MSDTLSDTLTELEAGLPQARARAEAAKAEWEKALTALTAREQTINSIKTLMAAEGPTFSAQGTLKVSGSAEIHGTRRRSPRSRTDVLVVMGEDGPEGHEWTIAEIVEAFDQRGWTVHMQQAEGAIRNMTTRLVKEDRLLERVRPGVFRWRSDAMDRIRSRLSPGAPRAIQPANSSTAEDVQD